MKSSFLCCYLVLVQLFVANFSHALTFIDILEFQVEGNSLLTESEILPLLNPYLGKTRLVSDVDKAAEDLQKYYHSKGYPTVYVRVPPQDVVAGVVKLKVLEAKINRLKVDNAEYFLPSNIKQQASSLSPGQVLNLNSLQDDITQLNRKSTKMKVIPVVQPSNRPGMVDVTLNVEDQLPFSGALVLNNYHSSSTSETRLQASLNYSNLWQKYHSASINMQVSPQEWGEVEVLAANYTMPIGKGNKKLQFKGIFSDSEISVLSGTTSVIGDGLILGVGLQVPLQASVDTIQNFGMGLDYKKFDETLISKTTSQVTPIDYVVLNTDYNLIRNLENAQSFYNAAITMGLRGLGNSEEEFNNKQVSSVGNFLALSLSWEKSYILPKRWKFKHLLKAQLSDSPLITNEQFSLGGVGTVRAYYDSQISGDLGVLGSMELIMPSLESLKTYSWLSKHQLSYFYDTGYIRKKFPLGDVPSSEKISSAGFTLLTEFFERIDFRMDTGVALKSNDVVESGDIKTRAQIAINF